MAARRVPAPMLLAALLVLVLLAVGALAWLGQGQKAALLPARAEADRPKLLLLTSLPLIFPEQFSLDDGGSPALDALERRYAVEPIGVSDAQSLGRDRLLLMAHPRAQTAEALVDLDRWVKAGGRALILADPRLDWPSDLPLGHSHRPPPYFADTGLLRHWGLTLEAEGTGAEERRVGRHNVRLSSAGRLAGSCQSSGAGLVARCAIGRGRVTIIADADLLQPPGASRQVQAQNLDFLLSELALLEQ